MSQQNNQDIDKDSEDRIRDLEAAVWNHSAGNGQAYLIDAAKGRLRQYHRIYRKALADAIRRPMGVIQDSAIGLVDRADIAAAERRREPVNPASAVDSGVLLSSPLTHLVVLHRVLYETIDKTEALKYLHSHLREDADLADMGRPLKFQYKDNNLTEADTVVDSTDLVARLRVGIQWRAEILTAGGTELIRDLGATEDLMRQAANRIEELEHATALSEVECEQIEESCQQMLAAVKILQGQQEPSK